MTYHPFLAVLARHRLLALIALLLQARGAGTERHLDELAVGRMSRDQLMAALLEAEDRRDT